jgi:hypothetical protein
MVVVCRYCNAEKGDLALWEYEGMLLVRNPDHAGKVRQFRQWVTAAWNADERAQLDRLVAGVWNDRVRASMGFHQDARESAARALQGFIGRHLRASMEREKARKVAGGMR